MPSASAPTYSQLYTQYFAAGSTPGHCANDNCHGEIGFNIWKCGSNKSTCFQGMIGDALINAADPIASRLGDPKTSPLTWINTNGTGFMPQDALGPNPAGRDAILAWLRACAMNN